MTTIKRIVRRTCGFLLCLAMTGDARAIPAFSRKYGTSCVTCHESFPRRNITGEAFRLRGYRFVDDEVYRKMPRVELGDEAYKNLWPKALWPTDISYQLPFSVMARFLLEADLSGDRDAEVLFLFPEELELVWAGTLGSKVSYYGDIIFIQKDFDANDIETWAELKARVEIHNIVGPENLLNLNFGTVGTQTMGLYPAPIASRLSTHPYQYANWVMPKVDVEAAGLADFWGNPFSLQPQVGFELYGFGSRWQYSFGLVAGDVSNPVHMPPSSDVFFTGSGRNRGSKDGFMQLAYKFGGLGFDGSGAEVDDPLRASPQFWRDNSLIASLYGYMGRAQIRTETLNGDEWKGSDEFYRIGAGLQHKYNDLTLAAAYMYGHNDRPYGNLSSESVNSHAWYAEANYFVFPWLIPYTRYEALYLGLPTNVSGLNPDRDTERVVLGAKAMVRPNISVTLESTLYTKGGHSQQSFDKTLFLLFSMAF